MLAGDRQLGKLAGILIAFIGVCSSGAVLSGEEQDVGLRPGVTLTVTDTFDGRPFSYQVTGITRKENYQVVFVRYPSPVESELPQNNIIPVEYYLPTDVSATGPKRPAVICLHILDGSLELVRMLGSVLASHGVAAVVFPLPYYGERGGPSGPRDILGEPQRFLRVLEQTYLEVRRATDFLASRPEVNPQRIGVAGISLGAIVAASAAEREPRIWRAALILSGGDILKIVATAREAEPLREFIGRLSEEERAKVIEGFREADPITGAHLLRERALAGRVLMINAAEDEVIPRDCTDQLAAALGIKDRVVWLEGLGHYTAIAALPEILQQTAGFFAQDVPEELQKARPIAESPTPLNRIAACLREMTQFYTEEPRAGTCHILHLASEVEGQTFDVLLIRGRGHQFRLEGQLGSFGRVMAGQGDYPWLVARTGKVFAGEPGAPLETKSPLTYVQGVLLERLRFTMLALAGLAGTPAALEPLLQIKEEKTQEGVSLTVWPAGNESSKITLTFGGLSNMPNVVGIASTDQSVTIRIKSWQLHAPVSAGVFSPPAGGSVQNVSRNDLYRMFGALVNFAAEQLP
ncbi:prolyl oligopeptidase family serine peptidase [Thermogutta sp.]|uniref:alpha/beta hydrolase n=1 Tax=Thermogutta sp. TaxID=1962930 RepID=UPI00321FBC0E